MNLSVDKKRLNLMVPGPWTKIVRHCQHIVLQVKDVIYTLDGVVPSLANSFWCYFTNRQNQPILTYASLSVLWLVSFDLIVLNWGRRKGRWQKLFFFFNLFNIISHEILKQIWFWCFLKPIDDKKNKYPSKLLLATCPGITRPLEVRWWRERNSRCWQRKH